MDEKTARAIERLRHPEPGGAIARAQEFGIDLTLLIENLKRTPHERAVRLQSMMRFLSETKGVAARQRRENGRA